MCHMKLLLPTGGNLLRLRITQLKLGWVVCKGWSVGTKLRHETSISV